MPATLPRRQAWSSTQELHLVYERLFLSDGDSTLQQDGLSRIKVWIARGNCPHAVESTANLLELILSDTAVGQPSTSSTKAPSPSELRLSYSMAMIRFVNSLVDPLQTTYYARSIASLASQIDLPLAFVELRHQATHEDLPSLTVLREASRQALDWLYTHYWLPLLSPSPSSSSLPPLPLDTLRPSLTAYKSLLKLSVRDTSLASRSKNDLLKVYKEIEKWVVENALGGKGGGRKEETARRRALEGVVEALVGEAGGAVPLGKKKRPTLRNPTLPAELYSLWSPLLTRLDTTFSPSPSSSVPSFTDLFISRSVDLLCTSSEIDDGNPAADKSYALTLVAWVVKLVVVEDEDEEMDGSGAEGWDETTDAVVKQCLLAGSANALLLLTSLLTARSLLSSIAFLYTTGAEDPLATKLKPLLAVLRNSETGFEPSVKSSEAEDKVGEMERRWKEVEERLARQKAEAAAAPVSAPVSNSSTATPVSASASASTPASSWPTPLTNWTPKPIGTLPGGRVELLDLAPLVAAS